ncbi:MAG: hypothetical protein IJG07_06540 [Prevotella sp.]|nr:hypothetical protein [Prevotella sp.]
MKKLFTILFCAIALGVVMPQQAFGQDEKKEKKEKKKKEKKPFVWEMPKLTGDKTFDDYLKTCDTLYNRIRNYSDGIVFYQVKKGLVTDKKTGEQKEVMGVFDEQGNYRSSGKALAQYAQLALQGTGIIADLALITTSTAAATTALPGLGMKAFSYGKYLKAGPKIVQMGTDEIGEIVKMTKTQAKEIRALRKGYNEEGQLKDPSINPADIDGVDLTKAETIQIEDPDKLAEQMAQAKEEDKTVGEVEEF